MPNPITVSPNELLSIIGEYEITARLLRQEVAMLTAKVAELTPKPLAPPADVTA